MAMRPLQLPRDLLPMAEMTKKAWQYPENPEWGLQPDEEESITESMQSLKRIWPVIRLVQWLSPNMRDLLRGYAWEEDGQLVGFTSANRQGGTDTWYISAVGVRPAYRRRGIALKLVEATNELIRTRGGHKVLLDMTDGNTPAYKLYEKLGFEHYSSSGMYHITPDQAPPEPPLPEGYLLDPLDYTDWRSRYELERRITPESLLQYEPVEQSRYRRPLLARLLRPIVMAAERIRRYDFVIRTDEGQLVAWAWYEARTRSSGVNSIEVKLDPAHDKLSIYLINDLLHKTITLSPGHRVEIIVPTWMEAVTQAVEEACFKRRLGGLRMGLLL
jgi:ribosomal protein S18 acetylase RimI-like enzyme